MCHLREKLITTDILKTIETLRDFQSAPILRRCPLSIDREKYTDYRKEEHFCERFVVTHWELLSKFQREKKHESIHWTIPTLFQLIVFNCIVTTI